MTDVLALRIALCAHGYIPVPLFGKVPPAYGKNNQRKGMQNWQLLDNVTREQLEMWGKTWPDAINTGILTKRTPTFDADILSEEAARATEDFVRARVEQRGFVLVRRGLWPKFCIPFRTDNPFKKIVANIISPHGRTEKIEFLGDGQQVVAEGIHPDTGKPYTWFGGEPWSVAHDDLPSISEDEARQLVNDVVEMLCRDFGYAREAGRPKHNGGKAAAAGSAADRGGADDWQYLYDNILKGNALHDSLRDLAAKLIASGTSPGAAVNQLRALMEASTAPTDERWKERHADIPRLVDSAVAKFRTQDEKQAAQDEKPAAAPVGPPLPIDEIIKVFERWLLLKDYTPLYAVLGTVAANYLEGDPVWLGVIGPPSSAKTEFLNATSMLPHVAQAATLTQAALLSGTPKKQQAAGAKGGLLRQIGDFGIIILKDFGSILSMHTETRAEVLAALREIYDGAWTRYLGSEGGKKLEWKGKLGLIFAGTGVIDAHYAVIGAMGDRFLLSRLAPTPGQTQFRRALGHTGSTTKQMRKELAEAVARLFAGRRDQPQPISNEEANSIGEVISLAVRLRGAVERDRRTRELDAVYGAEGTARIGLALERLLAGLDTLGVERKKALEVVKAVALDSVPPLRRAAYEAVDKYRNLKTADVAISLGLPTVTARRVLEDLAAYGLVERQSLGQGQADLWDRANWEAEDKKAEEEFNSRSQKKSEEPDRSGAVYALQGMKQPETVPCAYCDQTGDVYQFADGRLPKGQRQHSALHAGCVEAFFTGQPKPPPG